MKKALQLTQILRHGRTAHREGRLAEAERSYQAVLEVKRDDSDSLHLLGVVRWQQARRDEASKLIKQTLRARADSAAACANLAIVLQSLQAIRRKLMQNRQNSPLFATERTCRHIEAAYVTMWETYLRGAPARGFRVEPN
jgi:Flp pilus assembly protein TadD